MAFFGKYSEVVPNARLVWTNEEDGEGGAVTTVTFEERGGETVVVMHELYPSKEALDGAIASGSTSGFSESFEQLDEVLATTWRERVSSLPRVNLARRTGPPGAVRVPRACAIRTR